MAFDEYAATAIAVRLLQASERNELNDIIFMKLLYLVERASMMRSSVMMTNASLFSMEHGPVLSEVYSLMTGKIAGSAWTANVEHVSYNPDTGSSNHLRLRESADLDPADHLSKNALKIVDSVWQDYGSMTKWKLRDLTHDFGEWNKEAEVRKTSIPLPLIDVFRMGFRLPDELAEARAQEAEYFRELGR